MQAYTTIKTRGHFEYEDRKSRFFGDACPVSTEEEALSFIEQVKKRFPDATHHVYAYIIKDNSIMRYTDDREPQGTAGMPVLDIIRKNGCTNTVIVVTRYFGGTLLGTGGLVHAYSAAALGALKDAEIITYDLYREYSIVTTYSDYQKLGTVFSQFGFRESDSIYSDTIEIIGKVKSIDASMFEEKLTQVTSGRINFEKKDEIFDF